MIYELTWRAEWLTDGATSVEEMIEALQTAIRDLQELKRAGIELDGEVSNGYGYLITENPIVAARFSMQPSEDEDYYEDDDDLAGMRNESEED